MDSVLEQCKKGKEAAKTLGVTGITLRNNGLKEMANALIKNEHLILEANAVDLKRAKENGMNKILMDRLILNEERISKMADNLNQLINLSDPIGNLDLAWRRPNGIEIGKRRVPLGVISIIYEARPNVTSESAGICLKSGNVAILKGSSSAQNTNKILVEILHNAGLKAGLPENFLQLINDHSREGTAILLKLNKYIDVLIPRGGSGLIANVIANATMPVIETGTGNCHCYIDDEFDLDDAINIVINGKTQRPSVCNSLESLVVNKKSAEIFLPAIEKELNKHNVRIYACRAAMKFLKNGILASEEDFSKEYLDYAISVVIVNSLSEAIEHINEFSTHHSEVIVSKNYNNIKKFLDYVDSACVYANASTRFSDGDEFGFGAEIGISTQKLHARGPMGLSELTTYKYIITGNGQITK